MCHYPGQSRFNREPGYSGARVGKPDLSMCKGRAFHKAGSDIEKALDLVLFYSTGNTKLFEFVGCRYFEHFGRTSKSARYAGWLLSFKVRKVIVDILKLMRDLTESQCNRFRIETERLNRDALVTTVKRQLWTHWNLAISFSAYCETVSYNNLTC